jgi:hypothetical protein
MLYVVLELWVQRGRRRQPFRCAVLELRFLRVLSGRSHWCMRVLSWHRQVWSRSASSLCAPWRNNRWWMGFDNNIFVWPVNKSPFSINQFLNSLLFVRIVKVLELTTFSNHGHFDNCNSAEMGRPWSIWLGIHYKKPFNPWRFHFVIDHVKFVINKHAWRFSKTGCITHHRLTLWHFYKECHRLMQFVTFLHRHRLGLSPPSPTQTQFLWCK